MTSILAVLGVIVGVTWINTRAVADVMLFQVNRPYTPQTLGGSGIVYPRQRFDLFYPAAEQALEVLVKAGDPTASHLLKHPLAPEAGGDDFHGGGHQFASMDEPEWKTIAEWVKGAK